MTPIGFLGGNVMPLSSRRRSTLAAALFTATLAVAALPLPALAEETFDLTFPAGWGCDFALGINIAPAANRVTREFTDSSGNVVRTISAGRGSTLSFTNVVSGASVGLKSNGSVMKATSNPDGSSTVSATGHNVIILFPTDVPAGPTTTLYVGRVVYTSTAASDFTIVSTSGHARDICAELD